MAGNSTLGRSGDKPADKSTANEPAPKSGMPTVGSPAPLTVNLPTGFSDKSSPAGMTPDVPAAASAPDSAASAAPSTVRCSKCGASVRSVARFCQHCHTTMRFECPACGHSQRVGGTCQKCGIDFIKYIGAVVAAKQAEADALHEKIERRSTLMKNLLLSPFTGGINLVRFFLVGRDRKS